MFKVLIIVLMRVPAHIKKLIFSLVLFFAVFNFVKTTLKVVEKSKRLEKLKLEVSSLEKKRLNLQSELTYKESEEFVVQEARNELGMVKPKEELFVVSAVLGNKSYSDGKDTKGSNISNAKQWLELFLQ